MLNVCSGERIALKNVLYLTDWEVFPKLWLCTRAARSQSSGKEICRRSMSDLKTLAPRDAPNPREREGA
jgi:hypothetical protein